jgi:hypothetical protein
LLQWLKWGQVPSVRTLVSCALIFTGLLIALSKEMSWNWLGDWT